MTDEILDNEDFLEHFGIKGMKWGVRHAIGPEGRVSSKRVITPSSDAQQVHALRTKHVSELSNQELRQLTQRVDLEQKYSKINPTTVKRGKLAIAEVIATGALITGVYNLATSNAAKAGYKIIGKHVVSRLKGPTP